MQGSVLRPRTLGCPGRARRHLSVTINGAVSFTQAFIGEESNIPDMPPEANALPIEPRRFLSAWRTIKL